MKQEMSDEEFYIQIMKIFIGSVTGVVVIALLIRILMHLINIENLLRK